MSFRKNLVQDLVETCSVNGCLIKKFPDVEKVTDYQHAPISMFPTPYPFHIYKQVHNHQQPLGRLVSNLAANPKKLEEILGGFLKYDQYLADLVKVSQAYNKFRDSEDAEEKKKVQAIQMCILRCDFMIDQPNNDVKLVEYNTIASSFGVLSQKVKLMQKYIREKYGDEITQNYQQIDSKEGLSEEDLKILNFGNNAMNDFTTKMIGYFNIAIQNYKTSMKTKYDIDSQNPWVLFVITDDERNVIDQKIMEYELHTTYKINSMRCTLEQIGEEAEFDQNNHILRLRGKEIGFVYYRSGYQVEHYPTQKHWDTRIMLENSQAIKCPSIDYHLCTFKKFQQSFCNKQVIKDVLTDKYSDISDQMGEVFRGMWSLEDYENEKEVQDIVHKVIENANDYVVKPQKEGGGNNFYDEEASKLLKKFVDLKGVDEKEYESMKQFMIMEKIIPPMIKSWMLKDGQILEVDSLSELGLYSFIMIDTDNKEDNLIHNENTGTLMRTKGSHSNEGGVNAGFAVIDSPILYFEDSGKVESKINPNVSEMKE